MILKSIVSNSNKNLGEWLVELKNKQDEDEKNQEIDYECPVCMNSMVSNGSYNPDTIQGKNCNHRICGLCYRGLRQKKCVICRQNY
jgi:hypothetical protein